MTNILKTGIFSLVFTGIVSCDYNKIEDVSYPDETLYLPAAVGGVYYIDSINSLFLFSTDWVGVTPGKPARFSVNRSANEFRAPLGVYRSGIRAEGRATANIGATVDTVASLINNGSLEGVILLPDDKFKIDNTEVKINKSENTGLFNLIVDLNFLKDNAPQKYAVGLSILTADREINPLYKTVVIVIDAKLTQPTALFTFQHDASQKNSVKFTNKSFYWESFLWDFGDGFTSTEIHPAHTYSQAGDYDVTLQVTGIAGNTVSATQKIAWE